MAKDLFKDWARLTIGDEKTKKEFDSLMGEADILFGEAGYDLPEKIPDWIIKQFGRRKNIKDIKVLDLCCGTGLVGQALSQAGFENIHGVDFSKNIKIAEERGFYTKLISGNINNLSEFIDELDQTYDVVVMADGLGYFENVDQLFMNLAGLLDFNMFLFSQRSDMCGPNFFRFLADAGLKIHRIFKNENYLPNSEHYKNINANIYIVKL